MTSYTQMAGKLWIRGKEGDSIVDIGNWINWSAKEKDMPFIVVLVSKTESLQKNDCIQICLTEESLTKGLFTEV